MSAVENPSAFPCPADDKSGWHAEYGMTLRDYFAGQAIGPTLIAMAQGQHSVRADKTPMASAALDAYAVADAMLAARQEQAA
ncbi:hypothetical protein [Sphingomonas parapaucimobilis]|uniref:Uncharacterized protein n=1 Tax=Sphingomonas parapaucimobilis NBRC 15100 TaxID=1219049 RepID=A0A0A1W9Q3_9SPHN|nr:hypothetical protein [Sphingomonas parapaucimobilis]GAM01892.1 hypothetical protein SP5_069_01360 [Sphingomonas parapaucimobilis NBRC 15100]